MRTKHLLAVLVLFALALLDLLVMRRGTERGAAVVAPFAEVDETELAAVHSDPARVEREALTAELGAADPPSGSQPRSVPRAKEEEQSVLLLSGTIVLLDELGIEHPTESGRLALTFWRGNTGVGHEVEVEQGTWSTDLPARHAGDSIAFRPLLFAGRSALLEPVPDERFAIADDGRFELRGRWIADTLLRVRDRETGRELAPVLFVDATGGAIDASLEHPGPAAERALDLGASPVRIVPTEHWVACWMRSLRVTSPGYAWSTIEIDARQTGERVVLLERAAELEVRLSGAAPDPRTMLRLHDPAQRGSAPVLQWPLPEGGSAILREIRPGRFLLRAEVGELWNVPLVVGEAEATLVAGERSTVSLAIAALDVVPKAALAGELVLPAEWELRSFGLRFALRGTSLAGDAERFRIARGDMERVEGARDTWRWTAPAVQPGRYQVELAELGLRQAFEVPPGGMHDLRIEVPPPCDVAVRCVDADSGAPAATDELRFTSLSGAAGSAWSSRKVAWNAATQRFEFRAPVGELFVVAHAEGGVRATSKVVARPGGNEFVLRLPRPALLAVELRDGEVVIPWDREALPALEAAESQAGLCWYEKDGGSIRLLASDPGAYRLRVPAIPGYEPIPDVLVRLEQGVVKEHVIQLRRLP